MRRMTKSPLALCEEALAVVQQALTRYSSPYSRRDSTQHRLLAILVLRRFFETDYRGICQRVREFFPIRDRLRLKKIPHDSTLCYAESA